MPKALIITLIIEDVLVESSPGEKSEELRTNICCIQDVKS